MLWVNEASKTEDNIFDRELKFLDLRIHCEFNVTFKKLKIVVFVVFLPTQDVDLVEILLVVLAQVADKVLVDDLISYLGCLKLTQFEFYGVLIEHSF